MSNPALALPPALRYAKRAELARAVTTLIQQNRALETRLATAEQAVDAVRTLALAVNRRDGAYLDEQQVLDALAASPVGTGNPAPMAAPPDYHCASCDGHSCDEPRR